jgi:hypothetical protein
MTKVIPGTRPHVSGPCLSTKHSATSTILPEIHGEVFPIPKRQGWCSVDMEVVFRDITTRVKWLEGGHRRPHASIPSKQMFRIRIRRSREEGVQHDHEERPQARKMLSQPLATRTYWVEEGGCELATYDRAASDIRSGGHNAAPISRFLIILGRGRQLQGLGIGLDDIATRPTDHYLATRRPWVEGGIQPSLRTVAQRSSALR